MIKNPILVVDDNKETLAVVCEVLNRAGYDTLSSTNGHEAWVQFETNQLSLLITDLELPDITGADLTRRIRTIDSDLPSIIMSANRGLDVRLEAMEAGAYTFIPKPLHLPQFVQFVNKAIASSTGSLFQSRRVNMNRSQSLFFKWTRVIKFRR